MNRDWRPYGVHFQFDPPRVGDLVAIEHMALRVWDVSPRDDGTRYAFHREHGPKHPAENSRGDLCLTLTAGQRPMWRVYESGVLPLCSCHGHPWPCQALCDVEDALRDMRRAADMAAKANDGCCLACGEPVTTRQGKVLAPEPNVVLPGFPPPLFHTRQACRAGLAEYDRARRARLGADWTPLLGEQPELEVPR